MMDLNTELVEKILMSVVAGGLIGLERELRSKSAGFRTLMLICLGSTLFTVFSQELGAPNDITRIAANIVVGIGFVGAGVIFKVDTRVNGITTAATIWVTAAMGMGIGTGHYILVLFSCFAVLAILFLFTYVERQIDKISQGRNYKIVYPYPELDEAAFRQMFRALHLSVKSSNQARNGSFITGEWLLQGTKKNHQQLVEKILADGRISVFEYGS
jgi:putative Mg2+ transporter-C (MgtC) family protein